MYTIYVFVRVQKKKKRNGKKGRNEIEVQEIKNDFIHLKRLKKKGKTE